MMVSKVSDHMRVGETWTSEWDVDWVVIATGDTWADVKRVGGRAIHRVTWTEVEHWERAEVAAMREP